MKSCTDILSLYNEVKDEIKRELMTLNESLSLQLDGRHVQQKPMQLARHQIDTDRKMKNYILQTCILNDTHTGINLGSVLKEA